MDNALLQEVTAKANAWLSGNFDSETKAEVKSFPFAPTFWDESV